MDLGRSAIETMILLSAPMLLFSLGAGLLVSIFQAVTQINEATLSFVPKILAVSSLSVPLQVRIGLVIGLTVILFPIVSDQVQPLSLSWPHVVPLLFTDFMVGMVLGFAISFVMNAFIIAGELVGIQMGINLI